MAVAAARGASCRVRFSCEAQTHWSTNVCRLGRSRMRGLSKLLGLFMALLGFAGLSSPAFATLPAEQPYRIANYGRLVTDVFINGQGPFSFLIDTASSRSLIFEHVRAQLSLAPSQPEHVIVYGINDVAE